ncbi:unnamed protein product [Durusdinium trenchii]|uniref:Uncharacterized protein n=2 Tax=Durusdinium trenchii TaxID=1381693 RepID=A0ABP0RNI7_9DINO
MLAGVPPFHDDDDLELMKKVKRGKWSFTPEKAWKRVSAVGKELGASDCPSLLGVAWCRGIAGELKNYPWCNGLSPVCDGLIWFAFSPSRPGPRAPGAL